MQEQERFKESLEALMEIAKAKDNTLTMDEIKEVFQDSSLEEEKFETIYAYLAANKVKIQNYMAKELSNHYEDMQENDEKSEELSRKQGEKDDVYVRMYMEDISCIEPCKEEEMKSLFEKIKQGDSAAKTRLIEGNLTTAVEIANQYRNKGITIGDLIQEGNMGLTLAAGDIQELENSGEVQEFLHTQIRQAIEAAVGEVNFENQLENEIVIKTNRLSQAAKRLEEELGRHPEVKETAEFMKITEQEIKDIMRLSKEIVAEHHQH